MEKAPSVSAAVYGPVPEHLQARREAVFLVLGGLFLGTLGMLNILGISRFINIFTWGDFAVTVAVGVLPYPLTFLCTDLISELYGKERANQVVWVGLLLNLWVLFIVWLGGVLPGLEATDPATGELLRDAAGRLPVFFEIRNLTFGAVTASMLAYLMAQFVDVYLFHFWKELTNGKHLWLRNNGSTLVSQLVDTTAVVLITHFLAGALPIDASQELWPQLIRFIGYGYLFKLVAALLDTGPFYLSVFWLSNYLGLESPIAEIKAPSPEPPRAKLTDGSR
ncbi:MULTISPECIES: queuosine precursor transporter [Cyanophyceae]|uniref:queuosine precursor transporter n=1 Tax=Cyanophyceae TaxID=3028117 RepID=UPI001687B1B4|nr:MULTISPECIES: queuosine precursor transporter [Cyanophyceae]MBD1917779.1 queuosine precursor transporter [Phormidium sp. FACHB-77]MBD2032897.1 queuosine precursor transporter [Phormidium sp. FACHB-322]MBD2051645.1 queuosine precursor transporter [Leptolyngbya sp. FACHB-60]